MEAYALLKAAIASDTGLTGTMLHIHGGMLIFLLARVLSGKPLGSFFPFTIVLILEIVNEVIDYMNHDMSHSDWHWAGAQLDFVSTLFWPFVLSFGVLLRPLPTKFRSE